MEQKAKQKTDCEVTVLEKQNKNKFRRTSRRLLGYFTSATFNQFYTLDEAGFASTIVFHTAKANLANAAFYASTRSIYCIFDKVADGNLNMTKDIYKLVRAYETDDGMLELSLAPLPHREVYSVE